MDSHRFDRLTKEFSIGASRRQVLRGLFGGGATAIMAMRSSDSAEAAPNACAQACADQPRGPRLAACKQACKQCGNSLEGVCFGFNIICCPEGTIAAPDCSSCFAATGELSPDDATFIRCNGTGESSFYDTYTLEHGGGPLSISLAANFDTVLYLYSAFDPAAPCDNLVASNDDDGCSLNSFIALDDLAAGTYTVVVTSFSGDQTGPYALAFNEPAPC